MSGLVLALLSAACWGLDRIALRRAVIKVSDATAGVLITVPLSLPFFFIILLAMGRVHDIVSFPWQSYIWLSVAGVIHFIAGRMLKYTATQLLGANISAIVGKISPIIAATLGISLLGELLTWEVAVGVLLIVFGVTMVSVNPKALSGNASANISSRGIFFALASGFLFGITPLFIKLGLHAPLSPVAATFVSYSAATIVLGFFLLSRKKRSALFGMGKRAFLFFCLDTVLSSGAQLFRYAALSVAPVSVVTPLISGSPVFVLGFSFLFNRRIEVFNRFVIMGIIITVIGAVLLA